MGKDNKYVACGDEEVKTNSPVATIVRGMKEMISDAVTIYFIMQPPAGLCDIKMGYMKSYIHTARLSVQFQLILPFFKIPISL